MITAQPLESVCVCVFTLKRINVSSMLKNQEPLIPLSRHRINKQLQMWSIGFDESLIHVQTGQGLALAWVFVTTCCL